MHATILKDIVAYFYFTVSRLQHFRTFWENATRRHRIISRAIHMMLCYVITNIISHSHEVMLLQNKNLPYFRVRLGLERKPDRGMVLNPSLTPCTTVRAWLCLYVRGFLFISSIIIVFGVCRWALYCGAFQRRVLTILPRLASEWLQNCCAWVES